ncbi:cellulose biosynthesis protein BcsN [Rhizobium halophilum]|uniref:cellulose biosynthesis protein BcsN n=1 Tax=Rhizobium halophilum TaxID=2846852 RepID=UPI001EFDC709|nr:cellulose biosynthesis protein BcsN [Rhizobium halophilum]MCF6369087.1 cellulose biosynthesis protein BcsN [Rhizobium halophilum]
MSAARTWMLQVCTGLIISAAAAGCSSTGTVSRPVSPSLVANEEALALPPPGGPAVIGVVERQRANGVEQTVSLATKTRVSGQNFLRIEFFGPVVSRGPTAAFKMVNEGAIMREAASAIPGVRLSRRNTFLQNTYGPFAYAAGRSAHGDTCIYAWQQIRAKTTSSGIGRNFGMIQVRWRLCDAHASELQLLSAVYHYTITGTFDGTVWDPFGEPGGADPRLGATGNPIYPTAWVPAGAPRMGYAGGVDLTPTASVVPPRDEFAIFMPELESREQLKAVAERLLAQLREPLTVNGKTVLTGASIGGVVTSLGTADRTSLLSTVDEAMYEAKARGRNCFVEKEIGG